MSDQVVMVGGEQATKKLSDFAMADATAASDHNHDDTYANNETAGVLTGVGIDDGTNAPASASATGEAGTVIITASAIYVCTATDTWKKADLATWT